MPCSITEIGKRIAAIREAHGLSQDDLAKKLNVSREVVAKWETGSRDIKTQYTIALADCFGISTDEILRGVKAENVKINRALGLSDTAISVLRKRGNFSGLKDTISLLVEGMAYEIKDSKSRSVVDLITLFLNLNNTRPIALNTLNGTIRAIGGDNDTLGGSFGSALWNIDNPETVGVSATEEVLIIGPEILEEAVLNQLPTALRELKRMKKSGGVSNGEHH